MQCVQATAGGNGSLEDVMGESFAHGTQELSPLLEQLVANINETMTQCSALMVRTMLFSLGCCSFAQRLQNIKKKIPEIRTKMEAFFESARRHRVCTPMHEAIGNHSKPSFSFLLNRCIYPY